MKPFQTLIDALFEGNQNSSVAEALRLKESGVSEEQIIVDGIETTMELLDAKCTMEQFNLLEIMLVGRAVIAVMKSLFKDQEPPSTKETMVLASLEGDVHDLGKNIVKTVMSAKGYRVIDCGKDCPVSVLIDTLEQENGTVIGISGLIPAVVTQVRLVRQMVTDRGLKNITIMVGGAALKQMTPDSLNVDYVAETAFDAFHYLEEKNGAAL